MTDQELDRIRGLVDADDDIAGRIGWGEVSALLAEVDRLRALFAEIEDAGDCGLGLDLAEIAREYEAADRVLEIARHALDPRQPFESRMVTNARPSP